MKFKTIITLSLFALVFQSCKKDENGKPTITIHSPNVDQTFALGSTVTISATATDDEAAIVVTNHIGDTVLSDFPTVHANATFDFNYTIQANDAGTYHLKLVATDHEMAQTEKTIMFNAN